MTKQKGFTLIELVVVIIILGILAVTAAPKFLDLSGDARASTIQGMKAALEGAATMTMSRAAIDGVEQSASVCLTVNGALGGSNEGGTDCSASGEVGVAYGYPKGTVEDLQVMLETTFNDTSDTTPGADWTASASSGTVTITPNGYTPPGGANCEVTYTTSTGPGNRPAIATDTGGC